MKPIRIIWTALICFLPMLGWGQYSMQEMGLSAGLGLGIFPNSHQTTVGPAVGAEYFFSHYACGKAYGLHFTGGINSTFPMNANDGIWIDQPLANKSSLQIIALEAGAYAKIRLHDYHRPKEWAVFFGPKIQLPIVAQYQTNLSSGSLASTSSSVNRIMPGLHLSLQFRRPVKKQSWFLEPGFEYYLPSLFQTLGGGNVHQSQIFLKFSYAFWDQRG